MTTPSMNAAGPVLVGSARPSSRLTGIEKFVALQIFLYWLVYENIIFFNAAAFGGMVFLIVTNGIKLFLPVLLIVFSGLPPRRVIARIPVGLYLLMFSAFLLWGVVPTVVSGDPVSWLKLLPRFVFFVAVVAIFTRRPAMFVFFAKCMVMYVLVALVQYVLVYATGAYDSLLGGSAFRFMAGPYGLLGNVNSTFWVSGAPFAFVRLCGFWVEPVLAAGGAVAAGYLARYLVVVGEGRGWHAASYLCFAASLLTLSVGGYIALASALLVGVIFGAGRLRVRRILRVAAWVPVPAALLLIAVFGRTYVIENLGDNAWARAIVGLRSGTSDELMYTDPSDGRLELASMTMAKTGIGIIGVGLQDVGSEGIDGSATAPLYWLLLTGVPGLALLLGREAVLLKSARSLVRRQPVLLPLTQALVAVMVEHLAYGTWMNPNYFIPAAMVLVYTDRSGRTSTLQRRLQEQTAAVATQRKQDVSVDESIRARGSLTTPG